MTIRKKESSLAKLKKSIVAKEKEIKKIKKLLADKIKECEKTILERKEYYEDIIGEMPGHVYWLDRNNIYLGCNDLQAKHAGLKSRKDIVGKTNYDLPWHDQAEELNRVNSKVMRTGRLITTEEYAVMSHGPGVYLSQKAPLKNKAGKIIGVLGISLDITAQKKAEEYRIKHEISEERAQVMKTLSGSIAHELRTPLATINLYADNLKNNLPILLKSYEKALAHDLISSRLHIRPSSLQNAPQVIKQIVQSCDQIINMLLMNIREAKVHTENFETCSIRACINEAISEYVFDKHERELLVFKSRSDFLFRGEKTLTKHIFFNLLRNAFYYIKQAGKGNIVISLSKSQKSNIVIFKDTAKGIPAKMIPTIFDRYVSHRHGGTGLGLAFCKMIMKAYGGDIICRSEENVYTEFRLYFPKLNKKWSRN